VQAVTFGDISIFAPEDDAMRIEVGHHPNRQPGDTNQPTTNQHSHSAQPKIANMDTPLNPKQPTWHSFPVSAQCEAGPPMKLLTLSQRSTSEMLKSRCTGIEWPG